MKKPADITPIPVYNPALGDISLLLEEYEIRKFCQAELQKMEQTLPGFSVKCHLKPKLVARLLAHQDTYGPMTAEAREAAKRSNVNWKKQGEFLQDVFGVLGFPSKVLWVKAGRSIGWMLVLTPATMRKFRKRCQAQEEKKM